MGVILASSFREPRGFFRLISAHPTWLFLLGFSPKMMLPWSIFKRGRNKDPDAMLSQSHPVPVPGVVDLGHSWAETTPKYREIGVIEKKNHF